MKSYQPAGAINRKLCWFYSVFFLICSKMTAVTVKLYWIDVKGGNMYVACQSSAPSLVWRETVEWCISFQDCGGPSPASLLVPVFQRKMDMLEKEWTLRLLELGATLFPSPPTPKTERNHNWLEINNFHFSPFAINLSFLRSYLWTAEGMVVHISYCGIIFPY